MERLVKYIVVPIEIWEDKELSWNEKALLIEIDSYTKKGKPCFISNEYISKLLNVNETNASKSLSRLIKKGYVRVTGFDGRKRFVESCFGVGLSIATSLDCQERQPLGDDTYNISTNKENTISEEGSLFGGGEEANCHEKPTATSKTTAKKEGANRPAASIAERENAFKNECYGFVGEFGERLVEEFVLYWTEPNKSKTRMRFEQQTTWDTHRRMLTWKRNNFNKYEPVSVKNEAPKEISAAEIESLMNWRRND